MYFIAPIQMNIALLETQIAKHVGTPVQYSLLFY